MPITQKCAAGARVVPILWRDCAWSVRIFVHTRIRKPRTASILDARRLPLGSHASGDGHPAKVSAFKGLVTFQPLNLIDLSTRQQGHRSAAFRPQPLNRSAGFRQRLNRSAAFRLQRDIFSGSKLGGHEEFQVSRSRMLQECRRRQECKRRGIGRLSALRGRSLQPKGCAPIQRLQPKGRAPIQVLQPKSCAPKACGAAQRLRPVLAFAASQLGGLAPGCLRIYSVFEHPHTL